MKISIAMATYNGAAYLCEQLASFASQTRLPDELIVTDDCSTDATCEIIRNFAATAPFPVRLEVNPTNLGFVENFGRALSLTTGDLVFLSDQDDVWFDTKIARMAERAEADPATVCFMNDAVLVDAALVPSGLTKLENIRALGLPDSAFVMGCCAAVTRRYLEFILPIPPSLRAHDYWIVTVSDLLGLTKRERLPLQLYRRHGSNLSNVPANQIGWRNPTKRLQRQVEYLKNSLLDGKLFDELKFYAALHARIAERTNDDRGYPFISPESIRLVSRTLTLLKRRRILRSMKFTDRVLEVSKLYKEGAYDYRKGVFVAVKDIALADRAGTNAKGIAV